MQRISLSESPVEKQKDIFTRDNPKSRGNFIATNEMMKSILSIDYEALIKDPEQEYEKFIKGEWIFEKTYFNP